MNKPWEEFAQQGEESSGPWTSFQPAPAPAPSTERTFGEAAKDVGASLLTGLGGVAQVPGQIAKLIPGLNKVGEALEVPGEFLSKTGEDLKSEGLKAREALRSKALTEAEKDGILSQFATAIKSTITDPALLTSFVTEQIPLLLGPAGAARLATKLGGSKIAAAGAGLAGEEALAAQKAAAGAMGQTAARRTGYAMQGADVSSDTYDAAFKASKAQGMSDEDAQSAALNAARLSFAGAAGASALTARLPGAQAIEKRLAGVPGAGRIPSALGEAGSEALEEGAGQFAQNLAIRQIDPTQSLTAGVGAAAGLGALGGGAFGAILGKAAPEELAPGQRPGETLEQTAARLNNQRGALDALIQEETGGPKTTAPAIPDVFTLAGKSSEEGGGYAGVMKLQKELEALPKEQQTPETKKALEDTTFVLDRLVREELARKTPGAQPEQELPNVFDIAAKPVDQGGGYPGLLKLQEQLKALPPEQQTDHVKQTLQDTDFVIKRMVSEQLQRQPTPPQSNVITQYDLNKIAFKQNDPISQALVGKDLAKPEDVMDVFEAIDKETARPDLEPDRKNQLFELQKAIDAYLDTMPGGSLYARPTIQQPSGTSPVVAGVPSGESTAGTVGGTKPDGVVSTTENAGQAAGREGQQPTTVEPPPFVEAEPIEGEPVPRTDEEEARVQELLNVQRDAAAAVAQLQKKPNSLYSMLRGALSRSEVNDISPDFHLKALINKQDTGTVVDMVDNGTLDEWLPFKMRHDSPSFDAEASAEYIKDLMRTGGKESYYTYDVKQAIEGVWRSVQEAESELESILGLDEINAQIREAADELREASIAEEAPPTKPTGEVGPAEGGAGKTEKKSVRAGPGVSTEAVYKQLEQKAKVSRETKPEPQAAPAESEKVKQLKEQRELTVKQLQGVLKKILAKYNLSGVDLNLEEGMADAGSYSGKLIKLALDVANPVQTLRHESIHAMKELGFFTDAQWKSLVDRADKEWINTYLKSRNIDGNPIEEGQQSRYDAYIDLYKGDMDAVIEEAIADAFGDYAATKPPAGMLKAILARMENLFKAIREAMNLGGYETAEDVFGKIERGALKPAKEVEAKEPAPEKYSARNVIDFEAKRIAKLRKEYEEEDKETNFIKKSLDYYRRRDELEYLAETAYPWLQSVAQMAEKVRQIRDEVAPLVKTYVGGALATYEDIAKYAYYGLYGNPDARMLHPEDGIHPSTAVQNVKYLISNDGLNIQRDFNKYLDEVREYADGLSNRSKYQKTNKAALNKILGSGVVTMPAKASLRAPKTQAFKTFFGNSKIVDKDGEPKVMYHGTASDISEFKPKQANAIFVTDDPIFAEQFADASEDWYNRNAKRLLTAEQYADMEKKLSRIKDLAEKDSFRKEYVLSVLDVGANIMPVYVRAEKPFDYAKKADRDAVLANLTNPEDWADELMRGSWNAIESDEVQEAIQFAGFDSFYVLEGGRKNLAVYSSSQIKSATGNIGTYDLNNPDIRKSLRSAADRFDNQELRKLAPVEYKSRYKLVEMPIDDFLSLAKFGRDEFKLENARKLLAEGKQFSSIPYLYVNVSMDGEAQAVGHEGRHRAIALAELGYTTMPVELRTDNLRWSEQDDPKNFDYLKQWPTEIKAEKKALNPNFTVDFPTREEAVKGYSNAKLSLRSMPVLSQGLVDRVNATTVPRHEATFGEKFRDATSPEMFTKIRQRLLNRYERLAQYDRAAAKKLKEMGGAAQLADAKAESAALFSDLGAGLVASAMGVHDRIGGIPVFRNGITKISNENETVKGLIAIFKPLAEYGKPEVFQHYQFWSGVQRGMRLDKEGREQLFNDPKDIARAKELEAAYPEFKTIHEDWIKYNNGLIQYGVDTGVLSKESAAEMTKHGDYVPFYRLQNEEDTLGPRTFMSIANVKKLTKLKGGEGPLGDFFENMVRNTQSIIQAGIKNTAAQRATQQALFLNQVERLNHKSTLPNVYRVLENGKETYYLSQDPLFIEAIKSLNMADLPFLGLFAGPANLLRNLVTKDPGFMLANMMRDSLSAWATSGVKMTPIASTIKQFGKAISGKSPELQALYNTGVLGGYDYAQGVKASGKELAKELRKAGNAPTRFEMLTKPVTSLWEALEKGTSASDAATRMEVYKQVLADTGNEAEAMWQSLEIMNFNRKGNSAVVRVLTAAVPFLNARMQGLDVLYRAAIAPALRSDATQADIDRMKTFWVRGATIMSLSVAYWAMTHDDDEYKKQEQETRDNYWLIPSLGVKIPIPFEVGVMFKVIPERIMEFAAGQDTGKDFMTSMGRQLTGTFAFNPIPQAVLPIVENVTNYSFFTHRPIIGKGLEDVAPEYQVGPGTTKFAQWAGKQLGYSPIKIDHLVQGYTGTMGSYFADTLDMFFNMNSDSPKASKRFEQMPVVKRFALDPEARGTVTAYYELKDSVDEVVRTANYLERTMSFEEYGEYMKDNINMFVAQDYVKDVEKSMKDLREMKIQIRSSGMDGDSKRDALTAIGQMEIQLTSNVKTLKKALQ